MNINWRVRIKNKAFWLALIPAVLLLVQSWLPCSATRSTSVILATNCLPLSMRCLPCCRSSAL